MKITKTQLKEIIKEELGKVLNEEFSFAELKIIHDAVYAAADQDVDKFEEHLEQLGVKVDPRFVNDYIMKIKDIIDDFSINGGFDNATRYLKELVSKLKQ